MKNQKGFTLVELLVGMAILSIVAAAITSFIVSGSRSYAAANTEIVVQQEAQLAMNQISDVVIDTTRSVNYTGYAADGSSQQAEKDADFTIDVEDKSLTLFNGTGRVLLDAGGNPVLDADGNPEIEKDADGKPIIDGGNGNQFNFQFYYDKSEEKLYYSQIPLSSEVFPQTEADGMVVLAEYVKDFSVDLSQVEEKRVVQLFVSYEYNNRIYDTSNNITIRNKVLVNSVNMAIDRSVELSVRPRENMVVLEPGEDYYSFSTPVVDGRNVTDKSVTWSITPEEQSKLTGSDTGFTDAANGIIHISSAEKANSFKVTVTTNAVDSQGNHASAEVTVYVKRAKLVNVYKSADDAGNAPNEISPGCTFTITANAEGNKLGVTCSNCGDDTEIDTQVAYEGNPYGNPYVWKIYTEPGWDPTQWLKMIDSDEHSATFYLEPDAPDDGSHVYEIACMSLLSTQGNSYGRHYDYWVPGVIRLTVRKKADLTLDGNFKYGDEPLTLNWDYPHAYAVVCVRIKEDDPNAPMANDRVMIFNTDGHAIRIGADLFGLSLDHNYYISMQVLDYQLNKYSGDYEAKRNELVAEYTGHLDSTGRYSGSIDSSSMLTVPLLKPQITFVYNNKEYTGEEININPISALQGGIDISCRATKVSSTRSEGERVVNDIKVNLYKAPDEDLYIYNESTGQYTDYTYAGGIGALRFNDLSMHKADTLKVKLDGNGNAMEAAGSYKYIPFFKYSNAMDAARFIVHYTNYEPNYEVNYYSRPESTIHFTIEDGGNLKDLWTNAYGNFYKGEIYFPLPSDSAFRDYFTLRNPSVQSVSPYNYFRLGDKDGNIHGIEFSRMTCKYISTEDAYEIELFYKCTDSLWGRKVEMSAGTFKCYADGTEWRRIGAGTLDEQLNRGITEVKSNGNARIPIGENSLEAYIPLPSDGEFTQPWYGGFGFDLNEFKNEPGVEQEGKVDGVSIRYRQPNAQGVEYATCKAVKCSYDADKKTYTLTVTYEASGETVTATFTCEEGSTSWVFVKQ